MTQFQEQFAYRWGDPGLTAVFKAEPEEFVVVETLAEEPAGEGEHVYLNIRKAGANTQWVAEQLASFAGINKKAVGYAGRKDRHAVTTQWFSCYLPGDKTLNWHALSIEGVEILNVTRHRRKLRLGEIDNNHFDILLRFPGELEPEQVTQLQTRLDQIKEAGFLNYFGDQRFGVNRDNLVYADRLLRKGERLKFKRDLYMSAARAWLFNLFVSGLVEQGDSLEGVGPLYGKSRDPQAGEEQLPEIYQSWIGGLRRLGVKVGERALVIVPRCLESEITKDTLRLRFSLPAGAFATSLIRELVHASAPDMATTTTGMVVNG